jgi:hypothetical protein
MLNYQNFSNNLTGGMPGIDICLLNVWRLENTVKENIPLLAYESCSVYSSCCSVELKIITFTKK